MPVPTARLFVLAALLPLAFGGQALADDSPRPKKPRPKDFDFGVPEPEAPAAPAAPGAAAPSAAPASGDPESAAVRTEIARLTTWPARDGVNAAESLMLRGPAAHPALVEALAASERSLQPGAAWVLGRSGSAEHVVPVLQAAARLNGYRAETFFEAAHALHPGRTKDWLIGFLSLERAQLREEATRFLMKTLSADDAARIAALIDSDKVGARVAGLRLLEPAGVADVEERLVRALSDVAPPVSRTAASALAFRATPESLVKLNALAREGEARERAYATVALVDVSRSRTTNAFEPATVGELAGRRGVLHPDKLNRVAGAVGLAHGAIDGADEAAARLLDSLVIDVLVDAIGGDHYRDFEVLSDTVFASLRLLSGQDFPATAVTWAQWWQRERGTFHARRRLKQLTPDDLPFASVRYEALLADGARRGARFVPEDAGPAGDALRLPRESFAALVESLADIGIFEGRPQGRVTAPEQVTVVLSVRNQESRVTVTPDPDPAALHVLRQRFKSLEDANLWQRYRDTDRWPDAGTWRTAQAREMAQAEPDERVELLRSAIVAAFDDLPDEARAEALDRLEGLGGTLTAVQARTLLAAALEGTVSPTEQRAVDLALSRGPRAEAREAALALLAERDEPECVERLADLLAESGVESVREAFTHPKPAVRQAGARAAADLIDRVDPALEADALAGLDARLRPGLGVLTKDEPVVHLQALLALVRLGDQGVLPAMERLYRDGDLGMRVHVTQALGGIPGDGAHGMLTMVLSEPGEGGGALRAAALHALARTRHPNAVRLLTYYLLTDGDAEVQTAAGDALVGLGTPDARFAAIEALTRGQPTALQRARLVDVIGRFEGRVVEEVLQRQLDDAAPEVVAAAALRAGEKGMAASVPHLIALLRRGADVERDRAATVLEDLTYQRIAAPGYGAKADQYESWWATAKVGSERTWFRDALAAKGYDVSTLIAYLKEDASLAPVPLLLRALRDEDPLLRQGAARALERLTGRREAAVGRGVPLSDALRVADRWSAWWDAEGSAQAEGRATPAGTGGTPR
jgi:HEAT repeat protein